MTDKNRFRAVSPSTLVSKLIVPLLATTRPKIGLGKYLDFGLPGRAHGLAKALMVVIDTKMMPINRRQLKFAKIFCNISFPFNYSFNIFWLVKLSR
jgi:hypothetical protein